MARWERAISRVDEAAANVIDVPNKLQRFSKLYCDSPFHSSDKFKHALYAAATTAVRAIQGYEYFHRAFERIAEAKMVMRREATFFHDHAIRSAKTRMRSLIQTHCWGVSSTAMCRIVEFSYVPQAPRVRYVLESSCASLSRLESNMWAVQTEQGFQMVPQPPQN